ncbi:MAG: peptide chain release factor N(5)-glutamine methyltransferase, partial [Gammaproteobacteria bacterium]
PETELLVEQALQLLDSSADKTVLDLGTGSGAIALAIAKERPHCQVTAIDQSRQALSVAQENARALHLPNVHVQHGHWCRTLAPGQRFDLIVANPPYIASNDPHLCQGDVRFEPETALSSGVDGLDDIREIAASARPFLRSGGWLLLEHGYQQGEAVAALLQSLAYQNISTHRDLAGLPRVTLAQYAAHAHNDRDSVSP